MGRVPIITLALTMAALGVALLGVESLVEFRPEALMHGQWWRVLTGHFAHYGTSHLGWDVAVFAVAGALAERRGRRRYVGLLLTSAAAVAVLVVALQPELTAYRGLSGIDSALFLYVAANLLGEAWRSGERWCVLAAVVALVAFGAKGVYEYATGSTIFAASDGHFTPVPLAHVVGGVNGLAWALAAAHRSERRSWQDGFVPLARSIVELAHAPRRPLLAVRMLLSALKTAALADDEREASS